MERSELANRVYAMLKEWRRLNSSLKRPTDTPPNSLALSLRAALVRRWVVRERRLWRKYLRARFRMDVARRRVLASATGPRTPNDLSDLLAAWATYTLCDYAFQVGQREATVVRDARAVREAALNRALTHSLLFGRSSYMSAREDGADNAHAVDAALSTFETRLHVEVETIVEECAQNAFAEAALRAFDNAPAIWAHGATALPEPLRESAATLFGAVVASGISLRTHERLREALSAEVATEDRRRDPFGGLLEHVSAAALLAWAEAKPGELWAQGLRPTITRAAKVMAAEMLELDRKRKSDGMSTHSSLPPEWLLGDDNNPGPAVDDFYLREEARAESAARIEAIVERAALSAREREVLGRMRNEETRDETSAETAAALGIKASTVRVLEKKMLDKLRRAGLTA